MMKHIFFALVVVLASQWARADESTGNSSNFLEAGASELWLKDLNPGNQEWTQYRARTLSGWEYLGRLDHLNEYGSDEGRITAGAGYRWNNGHSLHVELGGAPQAVVFPKVSLLAEYNWPITSRLSGALASSYYSFNGAQAVLISGGGEYYFSNGFAVAGRGYLSEVSFPQTGGSLHFAGYGKGIYFVNDDNRVWLYYSRGQEAFLLNTPISPLQTDFEVSALGVGGLTYLFPQWGLEANFEAQNRSAGVTQVYAATMALHHRW